MPPNNAAGRACGSLCTLKLMTWTVALTLRSCQYRRHSKPRSGISTTCVSRDRDKKGQQWMYVTALCSVGRMRYDGLLANRTRHQHVVQGRQLLGTRSATRPDATPVSIRLSGSLSRPDRTVGAPLSPVSRRADAARRRPGRHRSSPRDAGFVMTAHCSTAARAGFTAASTRVRSRVRGSSTTPARAVRPHPIVGSAHAPRVHRRATRPAHGMPPTIESP